MTQAQLAALVGASATGIANIEQRATGKSSMTVMLAAALGIRPEWLDDGAEPMKPPPRPSASAIELARQIDALPPNARAMLRTMVLTLGSAIPDDRVSQFIKPATKSSK